MFVVTVDQRDSRHSPDLVPDVLARLADRPTVRPFERTVGDEIQAVMDDATAVLDVALDLLRDGRWSVGIGAGPVHEPLPASTRASAGDGFVLARAAVEDAKSRRRPRSVAVRGVGAAAVDAEAVLTLLATVRAGRSADGWAVTDMMGRVHTQQEAARRLGISQQAVSKRLAAAAWAEEQTVRPTLARLLARAGERP